MGGVAPGHTRVPVPSEATWIDPSWVDHDPTNPFSDAGAFEVVAAAGARVEDVTGAAVVAVVVVGRVVAADVQAPSSRQATRRSPWVRRLLDAMDPPRRTVPPIAPR
jgi:hypothetical protein